MTAEELDKLLSEGAEPLLIDVRSGFEFHQGHLPGALNIPFWNLPLLRRSIVQSDKSATLVFCEHGPRAWLAGFLIGLSGVGKVDYLQGHMCGWKRSGRRLIEK